MSVPQFYRCFLILFHCEHQLTEDVHSSMPSKTTVVHLNRRVCDISPAATEHAAAAGSRLLTRPDTADMEITSSAVSDRADAVGPREVSS